ncbi:MAG TPA: PAS domain S-box protein [Azospirillum sp.]|nr:PAS domain S-box protein [Azospirillum sp.]
MLMSKLSRGVGVIIIGLLPLLVFALVMLRLLEQQQDEAVRSMLRQTAVGAATAIDKELAKEIAHLRSLAMSTALDGGDLDRFRIEADRLLADRPGWLTIVLTDHERQLLNLGTPPGQPLPPVADRQGLDAVWSTNAPWIGDLVHHDERRGRKFVVLRVPVIRDGATLYTLSASIPVDTFSGVLRDHGLPDGWIMALADRRHAIIGRTAGADEYVGTPYAPQFITEAEQGAGRFFFARTKEGLPSYATLVSVGDVGWTVALAAPVAVVDAPYGPLRHAVWAGGVVAALLAMGLLAVLLRSWQRARTRKAIRESEARFRALVEASAEVVWTCDGEGATYEDSPSWRAFTGQSYEEWLGWGWHDAVHPEDRERVAEHWRHCLAERRPYRIEARLRHRSGDYRWMAARGIPLLGEDGTLTGWVGMNTDITARREAEATAAAVQHALAESERRYRFMADTVPQIVWTADPDGSLDFIGAPLAEYLGSSDVTDCLGTGWAAVLHPDDLAATSAAWEEARRMESRFEAEYRLRRHDGMYRWHLAIAVPMRDTGGRVVKWFGSTMDVHDRRLQADALAVARDEAERANLSKSKFLAAASHDLRQPMQSVMLFASALERHVGDEAGRKKLAHLERGLDTLKGLLDSLLDISRLDAGLTKAIVEDIPLCQLVEHIAAAYLPVAASRSLTFTASACQGTTVRSDRTLLGRMIRNLVENALRYTERGGIEIGCVLLDGTVRLEVRDTGIGIPPEHLERIFDEFHQVANPERDRQQGLGLGLAIVRRLADLLGHTVDVRSIPGEGSVFSVEMALGQEHVDETPVRASLPAMAPVGGGGRLAVLVDDDAIVLIGLQAILAEWGFEVLAAGFTEQALDRLREVGRKPDIVIADYRLRDGRVGTEAVVRIREMFGAAVPGVILTGETASECQQDAQSHDVQIIHKPITPRQLSKVLDRTLVAIAG